MLGSRIAPVVCNQYKNSWPIITQFMEINLQSKCLRKNSAPGLESVNYRSCLLNSAPRCYCTETVVQQPQESQGILKKVLSKVGLAENSKYRLRMSSCILYESVADKINYLSFFKDFELPNTFNSWFLVTELHVWMLLVRAMAEGSETGDDGRILRNFIVEAMWGDVNARGKKLGAQNPSRTRAQIQILSEQFQAALIAYDEGIMSNDQVLSAALWRRFFEMNCNDYQKIERMVKYVRQQVMMLDNLPKHKFYIKPKIPWLDLEKITV